jgi:8-oxo-dGTP pyrophosphatase MutT (NUDIX family)
VALPLGLRRLGYRLAHAALRAYWFVRRPHVEGVKCVLTSGEQVLLVRHTYGNRSWDLPGGSTKRNEPPLNTARREMHEELGIDVEHWRSLGQVFGSDYYRQDEMHCFQAELAQPELTFDRGEIAAAGWFHRDRLPARLSPHVLEILERVDGVVGR